MEVHGYTDFGNIRITLAGRSLTVPNDLANSHRQMIFEWEAKGNTIPSYVPPPPTKTDVDGERDRRINGGFFFAGIEYQSRPPDRENIAGAATAALGAMMSGAQPGDFRWHGGAEDFGWIAADNSLHTMDAQTVYTFGQAAMAHKQAHIFAARALKDADLIPADFADDKWWP